MKYQMHNLKLRLFYIVLMGCFPASFYSSYASAEKYFTWVDEMGRVNHTVIPEEENPLIKREVSSDEDPTLTESVEQKPSPSTEANSSSQKNVGTIESQASANEPENPKIEVNVNDLQPHTGVVSEAATTIAPEKNTAMNHPVVPVARKVEINEDDYIDGDVLLEQGNIRDENDLPYYTWTDEQGIVRNTPYRPESSTFTPKATKEKGNTKPLKEVVVYSVYEEYRRMDSSVGAEHTSPQNIDSFAQKLFFDGQADSFIDDFSNACCVDLPKETPSVLGFEDSVYVEFDKHSESYPFSEGKSPFKLIELPSIKQNYTLKFKTFVKTSGKTGVKNGVFFPQIVFLNDQFEVLRIVRNPVLEYVPENWRRHGYLKGLFQIDGRENERYMLINTTKESLKARNQIENKTVVLLSNQKIGSFEIEALMQ